MNYLTSNYSAYVQDSAKDDTAVPTKTAIAKFYF